MRIENVTVGCWQMGNWLDAKYCEGLELDLNKL